MGNTKKDVDEVIPKRRSTKILEALDELENDDVVLVSSFKKKEEPPAEEIDNIGSYTDEEWMTTLASLKKPKCRKKHISSLFDGTDYEYGKPKKKKKKKKDDLTDYNEMFDKEIRLIQNQLQDQSKFVQSLQRRYDAMDAQKSTARGVGKYTTDLIGVLNSARALNKDLIRELVSTKKTIAELSMKEKKEFGVDIDAGSDVGQFASSYLKQIMSMKKDAFDTGEFAVDDIIAVDLTLCTRRAVRKVEHVNAGLDLAAVVAYAACDTARAVLVDSHGVYVIFRKRIFKNAVIVFIIGEKLAVVAVALDDYAVPSV